MKLFLVWPIADFVVGALRRFESRSRPNELFADEFQAIIISEGRYKKVPRYLPRSFLGTVNEFENTPEKRLMRPPQLSAHQLACEACTAEFGTAPSWHWGSGPALVSPILCFSRLETR